MGFEGSILNSQYLGVKKGGGGVRGNDDCWRWALRVQDEGLNQDKGVRNWDLCSFNPGGVPTTHTETEKGKKKWLWMNKHGGFLYKFRIGIVEKCFSVPIARFK